MQKLDYKLDVFFFLSVLKLNVDESTNKLHSGTSKTKGGVFVLEVSRCIASSRRSVSQGAAQKTAREKLKKARWEEGFSRFLSSCFFFIFSRAVFCAAPWLIERLEEATLCNTRRSKCDFVPCDWIVPRPYSWPGFPLPEWSTIVTCCSLGTSTRAKQLSTVAILLYRFLSCWCLERFFT